MSRGTVGRVGLIGTVKDEGPWLIEWIAHHKVCGFDRIAIASNNCSDGTDDILDRLQSMNLIRHLRNPPPYKLPIQHQAYRKLQNQPEMRDCDWLMALDVDEFLVVHIGDGSVQGLLSHAKGADQLPIRWRLFGDSGLTGFVEPPITEAFKHSEPDFKRPRDIALEDTSGYKTLVKTHRKYWMSIHYSTSFRPRTKFSLARFDNHKFFADGALIKIPPKTKQKEIARKLDLAGGNVELAEVYHYAVKTRQICALKKTRGDAAVADRVPGTDHYFNRLNRNEVVREEISKYRARVADISQKWLEDSKLRTLHKKSIQKMRERLAASNNS